MNTSTGKLEMIVTYLEMEAAPTSPTPPAPAAKMALLRAESPPVSFYRYLYNTVGEDWMWYQRRLLNDDELAAIIHAPGVEIYVLYVHGVPAGYSELDLRKELDINLSKLGMAPEFRARGFGRYLLRWTIDQAWTREPRRLLVDTCNYDDPRALIMYQRNGFNVTHQETPLIDDPRPLT